MNTEQELGFSLDYTCLHGRKHTITAPSTDLLSKRMTSPECACPERTSLKSIRLQIAVLDEKIDKLGRSLDLVLEMLRKERGK